MVGFGVAVLDWVVDGEAVALAVNDNVRDWEEGTLAVGVGELENDGLKDTELQETEATVIVGVRDFVTFRDWVSVGVIEKLWARTFFL